jgi:hypothetical protein
MDRTNNLVSRIASITLLTALAIATAGGCGSSTSTAAGGTTTGSGTTTSVYPAAYQAAKWSSNTTVTFPSTCSMSYLTTGVPAVHDSYYLAPSGAGQTVVATTPVSHMSMSLISYPASSLKGSTVNLNICPSAAASTSVSNNGAIGFLISGIALFNSYEATGTVALSDNVSYTFKDASGTTQTATFLDSCASHAAANMNGASTWHYHAVPPCVTSLVDTATGPSHLLGFALDGYPIYGGRDVNGNVIAVSQLDACNGITSATPEFASAAYHYVLPIGVSTSQSSISCFHGTVNATVAATAKKLACDMAKMMAMTTAFAAKPNGL